MAVKDISKKPYIVDNDTNIKVGIDLPIRRDDIKAGWFASTTTTIEAVKNNIRNLLNTNQGERLMQPTLGLNLKRMLFEQINEENKEAIAEAMVTLTDLHDQLAAILVQIQEAATVEQLQAINVKVQTISEGISMLVFVADYDYDGVINGLDQCPDTPITEISEVNGVGCSPSQLGG